MIQLDVIDSRTGGLAYGLIPTDHVDAMVLAADTAETYTVPDGAHALLFSADGDFYANPDDTAAAPGDEVADGTASVLNPVQWIVDGKAANGEILNAGRIITSISFIASADRIITIQVFGPSQ